MWYAMQIYLNYENVVIINSLRPTLSWNNVTSLNCYVVSLLLETLPGDLRNVCDVLPMS